MSTSNIFAWGIRHVFKALQKVNRSGQAHPNPGEENVSQRVGAVTEKLYFHIVLNDTVLWKETEASKIS